jgi:hypothetical protein
VLFVSLYNPGRKKQPVCEATKFKFQFVVLLDLETCRTSGATAAAGRNGFHGGEAVTKCNLHFVTDEECGRKSYGFLAISGFF